MHTMFLVNPTSEASEDQMQIIQHLCHRELWFLCTALRNIATIMHTKFVPICDDKIILQITKQCCKNDNQREKTKIPQCTATIFAQCNSKYCNKYAYRSYIPFKNSKSSVKTQTLKQFD